MARLQGQLPDLGEGCRPADGADRGGGRDLVEGADRGEGGDGDVGDGDQSVTDHEPALEQPVVGDELGGELRDRGAWPGDPAVDLEEPAAPLAFEQRLAVMQLLQEGEALAGRLERVEQLEDPA